MQRRKEIEFPCKFIGNIPKYRFSVGGYIDARGWKIEKKYTSYNIRKKYLLCKSIKVLLIPDQNRYQYRKKKNSVIYQEEISQVRNILFPLKCKYKC